MNARIGRRLISIILVVSLMVVMIPASVFAETADGIPVPDTDAVSDMLVTALAEDTGRREESVKHFSMSDHTFEAVIYGEPVHYLKDGEWKDIDNTLIYKEKTDGLGCAGYENVDGAFFVSMAENAGSNEYVRIEQNGYAISWGLDTEKAVDSVAVVGETEKTGDLVTDAVVKVNSSLRYENVGKDVDLEYYVSGTGVKENIVLKSIEADPVLRFHLTTTGLIPKTEKGEIFFCSKETGEPIFSIPAPYMIDAEEMLSDAVTIDIKETSDDAYSLTISADKEWLAAEERRFPVTIDPVITTKFSKSAIDATFVASATPTKYYYNYELMCVGWETSVYTTARAYVQFDLPSLNKGDVVIGASAAFNMYRSKFYNSSTPDQVIEILPVTSAWTASSMNWNNRASYDPTVCDYDYIKRTDVWDGTNWKQFDITKLVKQWYEGTLPNNGVMLKKKNESDVGSPAQNCACGNLHSCKYWGNTYPQIIINYRNNKGIEGYWSYTSLPAGSAGVASVNDYTGNLVFQIPLMEDVNELMPMSLSLVHNTYCAGEEYVAGKNQSSTTLTGKGYRLNIQQTLLPSSQYGLTGSSAAMWPYVYTDGDGTEHYIQAVSENNATVYKDEDGLGLTLTLNSGSFSYCLTDKGSGKLYFNSSGNLVRVQDANGHFISVTFDSVGKKIQSMTNSAGHTFTFHYSGNYVTSVSDQAGRSVSLMRNGNGQLTGITYPNGTSSVFTYGSDGVLTSAKDTDDYKLAFEYSSADMGRRVTGVTEYGGSAEGQSILFDRSRYNETVLRTAGMDGVPDNGDDILTAYQFDNMGRTVSAKTCLADGTEGPAGLYRYTSSPTDAGTLASKNKVSWTAGYGNTATNLLPDGDCTDLDEWEDYVAPRRGFIPGPWTPSDPIPVDPPIPNPPVVCATRPPLPTFAEVELSYDEFIFGDSSYHISIDRPYAVAVIGGTKCLVISGVEEGETYYFSGYVKVGDLTTNSASDAGAYVLIQQANSDYEELASCRTEIIRESNAEDIGGGWTRISCSFVAEDDVDSVLIYPCLDKAAGEAYFDGLQLEKGEASGSFNMISDGGFEKENLGWTASPACTPADGLNSSESHAGAHSLKITGESETEKYFSQMFPVVPDQGNTYIVSGWSKADAVPSTFHTEESGGETVEQSKYEIGVSVTYDVTHNGVTTEETQEKEPAKFNTAVSEWQYSSAVILTDYRDPQEGYTYIPKSITLEIRYDKQANAAYFDDIQLIRDIAQSYTYDEDGNPVSVAENAEQRSSIEYNGSNDLTKYTDAKGNDYEYTYDSNHNLLTATSAGGVVTALSYDSSTKNLTSVQVRDETSSVILQTGSEYNGTVSGTNAGAYLTKQIDQDGNFVTYAYDYSRGRMTSVTDALGNSTAYGYASNSDDRVQSVIAGGSKVEYDYSGGCLTQIGFEDADDPDHGETYSFSYDVYGNRISSNVGAQSLATYSYLPGNGVLDYMTYGNGDSVRYIYDCWGNVTELWKFDETENEYLAFSWFYDSTGTVLSHTDHVNERRYIYGYDFIGRLIREDVTDLDGVFLSSSEYTYDLMNNVTSATTVTGEGVFTEEYSYSEADDLAEVYSIGGEEAVTYEYDPIDRLTGRDLSVGNQTLYNDYIYKSSERNSDSSTVYSTTLVSEEIVGDDAFRYTYDANGNIISIEKGVRANAGTSNTGTSGYVPYRSYVYDSLNELIRENDATSGVTRTWEYDALGNILCRKEYSYTTTETLGTPVKTVNYRYGNDGKNGWNYLLTGVDLDGDGVYGNDETISYDEIGNPVIYLGAELEWEGRQLTSYSKDGVISEYTYDADGLRTSKLVSDGEEEDYSEYLYIGSQLVYEKRNDLDIYYFYDSLGIPTAIKWNDGTGEEIMYLQTNAMGDVIGLYDESGELMVRFEYDAWGNVISETGTDGTPLNEIAQEYTDVCSLRYRGYLAEEKEVGLYYLQSRYYAPSVGRFINCDMLLDGGTVIVGYNTFSYCSNNPVNGFDSSGTSFLGFLIASIVVVSLFTIVNLIIDIVEIGKIEEKVQDSYTLEEAEKEAANIYRRYSSDAKKPVEFKDDAVEIVGGYNVNSRFARLEICTIISRTGMTNRSPMNLAAEWEFHNLCYKCGIRPTSAEDATLDYGADPRWYVVLFSVYLENVGWV